jgi:DNA polymerase-3 subunit beta
MKIKCNQKDLSDTLFLINRAIPSKPTHPILANILMVTDKSAVTLTAFDLSLGIRSSFNAQVEEEGCVAIPARVFTDIITKLDGEIKIEVSQVDDAVTVKLKAKSGKYEIKGMLADEFPELPTMNVKEFEIESSVLAEALKASLFCASDDLSRQVLTGVHLTGKQDALECAATDGHRLSVIKANREFGDDFEVTIPAKSLSELEKILSKQDGKVSMLIDSGIALFKTDNHQLITRILEGMYPAYNSLIPSHFNRSAVVERKALISSIERLSIIADQKTKIVKIEVQQDKLILSCKSQDVGFGHEELSARVTGDSITVAFNAGYLLEGLKALPGAEVQVNLNQELTPVTFTPLGGLKMLYLAMPVQITS